MNYASQCIKPIKIIFSPFCFYSLSAHTGTHTRHYINTNIKCKRDRRNSQQMGNSHDIRCENNSTLSLCMAQGMPVVWAADGELMTGCVH